MNMKNILLTQDGLGRLQKEYANLVELKRPKVVARIQRAREFGDISENSEYEAAREEQAFMEGRIQELEEILKRAQVIAHVPTKKPGFVVIGSTVKVEVDGEIDEFMIVGSLEADPMKGKISNESPAGMALLGAKVGDVVEVTTQIVRTKYKVLEIR
ncbi:MAG: transcription elongation factor GreA [bacterium]|nr:transcription elongation factor GreA [bacterium]